MDKSEKEELRNKIWDFMLGYQEEHAEEPIPPTLTEIQERFGLSGRNVALAHVLELVEEGLVEVLDRGWRKYAARPPQGEESVTPVRMEDCLYQGAPPVFIVGEPTNETETPKT